MLGLPITGFFYGLNTCQELHDHYSDALPQGLELLAICLGSVFLLGLWDLIFLSRKLRLSERASNELASTLLKHSIRNTGVSVMVLGLPLLSLLIPAATNIWRPTRPKKMWCSLTTQEENACFEARQKAIPQDASVVPPGRLNCTWELLKEEPLRSNP